MNNITDKNLKSNNSELMRDKQIEGMAKVIVSSLVGLGNGNFNFTGDEIGTMFAKALYNAGYRKQSEPISCGHENGGEWISVDERLPNTNENVLVYVKGFPCFVYTYMGGNEWEDDYGYWHRTEDANVTHWMPLPEAPKGGAE